MIDIREISVNETNVFWDKHIKYLIEQQRWKIFWRMFYNGFLDISQV